jgi:hypothetical protein
MSTGRELSVFISHKHADRTIANVVREFVQQRTNREVSVFQSSAAEAESPELGRALSAGLKQALWNTGVVVLIYTTEDQDWQWCMWECGVALKPDSPDTRIIVLQCSSQAPRVFQDCVRVNTREKEDVLKFVKAFLTDPAFFPEAGRAVAPKLAPSGGDVQRAADDLFEQLSHVVPKSDVAEWSAQPLIQLQLANDVVEKLSAEGAGSTVSSLSISDVTTVSSLDPQARQVFGVSDLAPGTRLSGLALRWLESHPGRPNDWVREIEAQLRSAARNDIPGTSWGYLQNAEQSPRYVPILSRARRLPALRCVQFDVNLVLFDEFAATRAVARMIPLKHVVCHRLDSVPIDRLKVVELARRFKQENLSRMPFLAADNRVQLIVHRSMVDRYVADQVTSGRMAELASVSVADMMREDPGLGVLFETSFGTVAPSARLRDVNAIMAANHQIQDVFVTTTGGRNEPVVGWITNTMLAQHLT